LIQAAVGLRGMTDHGVGFRSPSSRKGVANAETQAQAHPTLFAKNKRTGRTLGGDLLAGTGEAGQRFPQASLLEWSAEGSANP